MTRATLSSLVQRRELTSDSTAITVPRASIFASKTFWRRAR
ncbi:hypothetical protein [Streptomyces sp. NPDC003032]